MSHNSTEFRSDVSNFIRLNQEHSHRESDMGLTERKLNQMKI
jgi:hypothetical protein